MAHSRKYQARLYTAAGESFVACIWDCRADGRPTVDNLQKYAEKFESDTQPGGIRHYLGAQQVVRATIMLYGPDVDAPALVEYTAS